MAKANKKTDAIELDACSDECARIYRERKAQIRATLVRLTQAANEQFDSTFGGLTSARLHYGHVGNLARTQQHLKELSDIVFYEGEYARR